METAQDFKPIFRASDVGKFCGKPWEKTIVEFLSKFSPFDQWNPALETPKTGQDKAKTKVRTSLDPSLKEYVTEKLNSSLTKENLSFNDKELVSSAISKVKTSEDDIESAIKGLSAVSLSDRVKVDEVLLRRQADRSEDNLDAEAAKLKREMIEKNLKRYVACERGKKAEKFIMDIINEQEGTNFTKTKKTLIKDFDLFKIRGIIDGIDEEKRYLLEVKTRNSFSKTQDTITRLERIQVLCYMALTDSKRCIFVEKGPKADEMKTTYIDYDPKELERDILSKLRAFVETNRKLSKAEFLKKLERISSWDISRQYSNDNLSNHTDHFHKLLSFIESTMIKRIQFQFLKLWTMSRNFPSYGFFKALSARFAVLMHVPAVA